MGWDTTERSTASGAGADAIGETTWEQGTGRSPVFAVVTAVAERTGREPTELPPLTDAIDPDALNALFGSSDGTAARRVVFEYCGYEIAVRGDGTVRLRESTEGS